MDTITTPDGVTIFYKDWGQGQPIVFHHGWPLSADDWGRTDDVLPRARLSGDRPRPARARPLHPDRHRQRHGTPTPPTWPPSPPRWTCATPSMWATPPAAARSRATWRSMGLGGWPRAVLISAVPPVMVKSDQEPRRHAHRGVRRHPPRHGLQPRPSSTSTSPCPSMATNRPGAEVKEGVRRNWWRQGMMGGVKAHYDCVKAFSETDFHRRPEADHRADPGHARRGRPDRALRRRGFRYRRNWSRALS